MEQFNEVLLYLTELKHIFSVIQFLFILSSDFSLMALSQNSLFQHLALLVINAGRNNKRLRSEIASKLKLAASAALPANPAQMSTPATSSMNNSMINFNPASLAAYSSLQNYYYPQQQQQQQLLQQQPPAMQSLQNTIPYLVQQHQAQLQATSG